MASHFEKLAEAKKEFKSRTGVKYDRSINHHSGLRIHHRKPNKYRKRKLKRPYFLGSHIEWLNL